MTMNGCVELETAFVNQHGAAARGAGGNVFLEIEEAIAELHRRQRELEVRALDLEAHQGVLSVALDDLRRQQMVIIAPDKTQEREETVAKPSNNNTASRDNLLARLRDREQTVKSSLTAAQRRTRRALGMLATLKEKREQLVDTAMTAGVASVHRQALNSIRPLMAPGGILDPASIDALRDEAEEQNEALDEAVDAMDYCCHNDGTEEEEEEEDQETKTKEAKEAAAAAAERHRFHEITLSLPLPPQSEPSPSLSSLPSSPKPMPPPPPPPVAAAAAGCAVPAVTA